MARIIRDCCSLQERKEMAKSSAPGNFYGKYVEMLFYLIWSCRILGFSCCLICSFNRSTNISPVLFWKLTGLSFRTFSSWTWSLCNELSSIMSYDKSTLLIETQKNYNKDTQEVWKSPQIEVELLMITRTISNTYDNLSW